MIKTIANATGGEHIEMTAGEVAVRHTEETAHLVLTAAEDLKRRAIKSLGVSDHVATRCFKAGVQFPPEWQSYVAALRAIVNGAAGPLPNQPEFPAGT